MFQVDGGTQALARAVILAVTSTGGTRYDFSVPDQLGALVLKGAACIVDQRDRDRHLYDAAVLAAGITDHASALVRLKGTDGKRLRALALRRDSQVSPCL